MRFFSFSYGFFFFLLSGSGLFEDSKKNFAVNKIFFAFWESEEKEKNCIRKRKIWL